MEIRIAEAADVETLFDIRTSVRENHQSRESLAKLGITPESVERMLATTARAWIGRLDGIDVAFSMADSAQATIFAMFVRPGWEGRGLGRTLMAKAEGWLWERGCSEIWLLTEADPAVRAYGFYLHLNWRAAGMQNGEAKFVKDRPHERR